MGDDDRHEQLVEELRLLLDAVAGRAEEYLNGCTTPEDGQVCCRCPFCAAMALLRGERTEMTEQLLTVVRMLRQALTQQHPAADPSAGESPAEEADVPAPSKVQHIQVQRVGGPVLAEHDASC